MEQLDLDISTGCAPTLNVTDNQKGESFWVSMAGTSRNSEILLGYVYPKSRKNIFGLGTSKSKNWVEIYVARDDDVVETCFEHFFARNTDELILVLNDLELFGEMEAQN